MEQHKASMTAVVSAFARAYHAKNDTPKIFNDKLAYELIGEKQYNEVAQNMLAGYPYFSAGEKVNLQSDEEKLKWVVQTQLAPTPLARARFCEDMLINAIQLGCTQYVILGAGLDTFSYRHSEMEDRLTIFELDHPATQLFKQKRLQEINWEKADNLYFIPIDFAKETVSEVLSGTSYNPAERAFFSWLGVTYYLDKESISNTLCDIAAITPKGSSILFDFPNDQLFSTPVKRVQSMVGMAQATGEPMKSCFSYPELESLLEKCDFLIYEHLTEDEIQSHYFQNRSDFLHAFETVEYVLAVKN